MIAEYCRCLKFFAQTIPFLFLFSDPLIRTARSTSVNIVVGQAGTGVPFVKYPQLEFSPANFFALGSPIAMFLTVRGVDSLGEEFKFNTCPGFYNIYHPVSGS